MSRLITAAVVAAALACATGRPASRTGTDQARADAKPAPGTRVVCYDEAPTGSHIAVRTCRRVADDELHDTARDRMIDDLRRPPGGAVRPASGG